MKTGLRCWLIALLLLLGTTAAADVQVFPLRGSNPQEVLETMRAALGNRAEVNLVQQKLVVVGDAKTIAEATTLLRSIDRLPATLRLTLTEIPPSESIDSESGMLVYTTDKNSQVVDTVEGALLTADFEKFHQTASTDGWTFLVNEEPVAVRNLQLQVRLVDAHGVEIMMSFTRHENQQRRVYGNIVAGELGSWIPLLPARAEPPTASDMVSYSSGTKRGEQLFLKVEKVFAPRAIRAR